nr:MAG TPA: TRAP-type C4-dicarboxylate transport system, periplasmic component [Caudoviricetes sp.]
MGYGCPVERLEDMNGLKMRTADSALMRNMVKALGAQAKS